MDKDFFQTQITRLAGTYGKQHYGPDRVFIIWQEIKDFSDGWFEKVVSEIIATQRVAPLVDYFRNEASWERDRTCAVDKLKHKQEAEEFFKSSYSDDERSWMIKTILKRMGGGVSDSEWAKFNKIITQVAENSSRPSCIKCEGSGVRLIRQDGGDYAYRCRCETGKKDTRPYPVYVGD